MQRAVTTRGFQLSSVSVISLSLSAFLPQMKLSGLIGGLNSPPPQVGVNAGFRPGRGSRTPVANLIKCWSTEAEISDWCVLLGHLCLCPWFQRLHCSGPLSSDLNVSFLLESETFNACNCLGRRRQAFLLDFFCAGYTSIVILTGRKSTMINRVGVFIHKVKKFLEFEDVSAGPHSFRGLF